jgi:hypothetical protein
MVLTTQAYVPSHPSHPNLWYLPEALSRQNRAQTPSSGKYSARPDGRIIYHPSAGSGKEARWRTRCIG